MGRRALVFALAGLALSACAGEAPPGSSPLGDGDPIDAGPAAPRPDARPGEPPPPPPPDAAPALPAYPPGPYGIGVGDVVADLHWQGYADTAADGDSDHYNEPARTVYLHELYAGHDAAAKVILVTANAGWCGPCQEEASRLPAIAAQYAPQGVRILSALFEDDYGAPADVAFALTWGETFDLTTPTVADPGFTLEAYGAGAGIPLAIYVDARTMTILTVESGFDEAFTRELLDSFL